MAGHPMDWTHILPAYWAWAMLGFSLSSLISDSTVWTLLGPTILRVNLFRVGMIWERDSNRIGAHGATVDFRNHRFLAYYTLHMTTFIMAWILFLVRFAPDALDLISTLKHGSPGWTMRTAVFGAVATAVFMIGLWMFWIRPSFVGADLIEAYRQHNAPDPKRSAEDDIFGPTSAPNCSLTYWRTGFLLFSIAAALAYPVIPNSAIVAIR